MRDPSEKLTVSKIYNDFGFESIEVSGQRDRTPAEFILRILRTCLTSI
jgi:hypothetical protein